MIGPLPLLALVILAYNLIVFLTGMTMQTELFSIALVSGAAWSVAVGDVLLFSGLVLLFVELVSAIRMGAVALVNHALSMLVLLIALVQFVVLAEFGNSTFFLLLVMVLLDVIAGFAVTITAARRDFTIGE